jgi:CheY-like chemotaxis protein
MPSGGTLIVETANVYLDESYVQQHPRLRVGEHVMVAVTDTGAGMTPEVREQIFEPFFTTKPKGHGTGLGLATVYGIVTQSGGWIWVYSEPGKGTTFKLYFPRTGEPVGQELAVPKTNLWGTETILVVEDQDEVRNLAVKALTKYGYIVFSAQGADEAIAFCERHPGELHLVLTDVVMPGLNGRELAKRLGEMRPDLQFLFMSGYTDNAIAHHGVLDESVKYIQKPFTPESLAESVRSILGSKQAKATVLLVDDDFDARTLLGRHLTSGGYAVLETANSRQAIAIAKHASPIDLLIVNMQELENEETMVSLRQNHPQAKIIAVSGEAGEETAHFAQTLGAAATLVKPVSREAILSSVETVLGK